MTTLRERVHMALAEAGYPDVPITGPDDDPSVTMNKVPDRVVWLAFRLATATDKPCFSCWEVGYGDECCAGQCMSEVSA